MRAVAKQQNTATGELIQPLGNFGVDHLALQPDDNLPNSTNLQR
jgi:hypothetical protein